MIEVQRHDLLHLPLIAGQVRGLSYRFIIFCDDLSFAAGDASYQELKTLLDGGIEARPDNLLIYATSNRRHLLPEQFSDNLDSEIHPEEAVADKLSLADRFGLSFGFYSFDEETYLEIVDSYARLYNLTTDREELHREAIGWAIYRGQRSGRAAQQFAADMAGREWMGRQND
jgi:predicted AAA+ superfamily ATPase